MDNTLNKEIQDKLEALRSLPLDDSGLLRGKEFHQVIKSQMDVMTSIFKQQHKDVENLTKSSGRLEKLTLGLIGLTIGLVIITIISILK